MSHDLPCDTALPLKLKTKLKLVGFFFALNRVKQSNHKSGASNSNHLWAAPSQNRPQESAMCVESSICSINMFNMFNKKTKTKR